MTQQFEADNQMKSQLKQQLIVCTNSGIKVYDISLQSIKDHIAQIQKSQDDVEEKPLAHFLKYKLSALPNEKILDLVMMRSRNGEDSSLLLSNNLGQYVLLKSDTYLVQWRFNSYNTSQ
jgi:hypothetical protein